MSVFVDTGAFVALALARDGHHAEAVRRWEWLQANKSPLVTTDWVFGETVTFIRRRAGYLAARTFGERLRSSRVLEIMHADADLVARGWETFLEHRFDALSLVDCVSFVAMRMRKLRRAFTFDLHFAAAGFEILP